MITIIGIGNEKGDLTLRALEKLKGAKCVFLRSEKTAAGAAIVKDYPGVVTLDDVFEKSPDFDDWSKSVCDKLIEAEKESGEAVYLTDGDGFSDGCAAKLRALGKDVQIIGGVAPSYSRGAAFGCINITASEALSVKPYIDTALSVHVTEIDDSYVAGDVKLWLMEYYGDETEAVIYCKGKKQTLPLHSIDRMSGYDYSCELFIAAQNGFIKQKYTFGDLLRIMERLTAVDGCPWDKAQTHESIRINMIEEAYEAVDAIDSGDIDAITEELGDVMLQSVFHCNMGHRFGEFDTGDVITGLCAKLVFRHTHIFGENRAADADEALKFWEAAKSEEKSYVSAADKINRLPDCFPALLAAQKVYKKLIKAGVKPNADEMSEFATEYCKNATESDWAKKLFYLTAAMSDCGVDAEVVLSSLIARIKKEFAAAEAKDETVSFLDNL